MTKSLNEVVAEELQTLHFVAKHYDNKGILDMDAFREWSAILLETIKEHNEG